jgi:hypothetical protein
MLKDYLQCTEMLFRELGRSAEVIILNRLFLGVGYRFNIQFTG